MNDNFGDISGDFLPEGYGDANSKVFQGIGMPAPEAGGGPHAPQQQEAVDNRPINPAALANSPVLIGGSTAPGSHGPTATRVTSPDAKTYSGNSTYGGATTQLLQNPATLAQREREMFLGGISDLFAGGTARNNGDPASGTYTETGWVYVWDNTSKKLTANGKTISSSSSYYAPIMTNIKNGSAKLSGGTSTTSSSGTAVTAATTAAKKEKAAATGTAIGSAAGSFVGNLIPSLAMFLGPTTAPVVVDTTVPESAADLPSATPWGLIIGIGAAVVVIGGGFYLATRHSNDPETAQ